MDVGIETMNVGFVSMDVGFASMDVGFASMDVGITSMDANFQLLAVRLFPSTPTPTIIFLCPHFFFS